MTTLLEKALERIRTWPKARQDDFARMALDMDQQGVSPVVLDDDEREALRVAWDESETGDFASAEEVEAAYRHFRP